MINITKINLLILLILLILLSSQVMCTIESDLTDDLELPFIKCNPDPCSAGDTTITISGYNNENHFSGYNVWYGNESEIRTAHQNKDRSSVIDNSSMPLNAANKGSKLPSISSSNEPTGISSVKVRTHAFNIKITNTTSGNVIFVSAYSSLDSLDSPLSNMITIP